MFDVLYNRHVKRVAWGTSCGQLEISRLKAERLKTNFLYGPKILQST
jgi:hypothetical protein